MFHKHDKSANEYSAGVYLSNRSKDLSSYLEGVTSVKEALSVALKTRYHVENNAGRSSSPISYNEIAAFWLLLRLVPGDQFLANSKQTIYRKI